MYARVYSIINENIECMVRYILRWKTHVVHRPMTKRIGIQLKLLDVDCTHTVQLLDNMKGFQFLYITLSITIKGNSSSVLHFYTPVFTVSCHKNSIFYKLLSIFLLAVDS
ncbi:hypothetical protein QVD17_02006 [Tagetes erecta]|uniref:Uncharacterized protein n=1 Tax=Tagetes erecta TaxID=13708 RepID=A0AAD8L8D6_TARER|nr:hypothetical protein QVD17_02006 [Tagetes erecta]